MAGGQAKGDRSHETLQDLYDQIKRDDAQKGAFVEAMRAGRAVGFLRERGCDATEDELEEFLTGKAREAEPMELDDDELMEVAGGTADYSAWCGDTESVGCSDTCKRDCC